MSDASVEPVFVAGHLALDFLNTALQVDSVPADLLRTDEDVLRWLELAGIAVAETPPSYPGGALVRVALELREVTRALVARRKAGKRIDPAPLNALLARGHQGLALVQDTGGAVRLEARFKSDEPEQLLMPVTLSAAELLATGDFGRVHVCERPDCVLQFYDRTKSQRRRWCSMATCGNRHKVSQFRARNAGER